MYNWKQETATSVISHVNVTKKPTWIKMSSKRDDYPKSKERRDSRSCTDIYCLFIFVSFVAGWIGIGVYTILNGDVVGLLTPMDSEGRHCGLDEDVMDKNYSVYFDLAKCVQTKLVENECDTHRVCVESCPTDNFVWEMNSTFLYNDLEKLRTSMICKIEVNLTSATYDEMATYVSNGACTRWYLKSRSWIGRCIPDGVSDSFVNLTLTPEELADATTYVKQLLDDIEKIVTNTHDDLRTTRWLFLATLGCSALVSLIYIVLLHWIPSSVIYVSIVATSALLLYSTYEFFVSYADAHSAWWLVFGVASGVPVVIVLTVCILLRRRILLACKLIGESSRAVINSTLTLFFPLVPVVFQFLTIRYAIAIAIYVLTLRVQNYTVQLGGNCKCDEAAGYANGTTCSPQIFAASCREDNSTCVSGGCYLSSTSTPWFAYCIQIYNAVAFYWITSFVSAFQDMVLAGTFATWYWTLEKSDVPTFTLMGCFQRTIRYHLGTLALGSLLLTIFTTSRELCQYFDSLLRKWKNAFTKFLLNCLNCSWWPSVEKFWTLINRSAYIMCAIYGGGLFASARQSSDLIVNNISRFFVLHKITEWLLFVGKVFVTVATVLVSQWYITKQQSMDINYTLVPIVTVGFETYLTTSLFFNVYSVAVNTIFHCFLEDFQQNDGTPEKPYYMSTRLKKLQIDSMQ